MWPRTRITELFGIELPILLAPMAGPAHWELAAGVCEAGGLGGLPCALLEPDGIREELTALRAATSRPINLNFFCHQPPDFDPEREAEWVRTLAPYYREFGLEPPAPAPAGGRTPFDEETCAIVEAFRPEVVSFHFGLPAPPLVDRVRATGARIIASATTVREAVWLAEHGCDAVIAQGWEAGGHRGHFLEPDVSGQAGTFALVPQVADAVDVPVIAAGGVGDARGIVAALALGADAVQIGTAYLFCPEARVAAPHQRALREAAGADTAVTNIFTGRPARGIVNRVMRELGPMSPAAPAFPLAGGALAPLGAATEPRGSGDFMSLWSGQAAPLGRAMPAKALTETLAAEARQVLERLTGS